MQNKTLYVYQLNTLKNALIKKISIQTAPCVFIHASKDISLSLTLRIYLLATYLRKSRFRISTGGTLLKNEF